MRLDTIFRSGRTAALLLTLSAALPLHAQTSPVKSLLEMRHENVVIQKWDLSCGAAALTTLLNYQHGEQLTEKEVAVSLMNRPEYINQPELIQIREGFSLLDLKRYSESLGYKGVGLGKMELKDLVARAPLLVPIRVTDYNHFVVFRGIHGDRVLLADPAWGNRTMRIDEFMRAWIDYPTLGKVGFSVERKDGLKPESHPLVPKKEEYLTLG